MVLDTGSWHTPCVKFLHRHPKNGSVAWRGHLRECLLMEMRGAPPSILYGCPPGLKHASNGCKQNRRADLNESDFIWSVVEGPKLTRIDQRLWKTLSATWQSFSTDQDNIIDWLTIFTYLKVASAQFVETVLTTNSSFENYTFTGTITLYELLL